MELNDRSPTEKQAERGYRGYPVPRWRARTGCFPRQQGSRWHRPLPGENASVLERWFSETEDVRYDEAIVRRL